jgi:hypothetical protein
METSTGITANSQDIHHAGTAGTSIRRRWAKRAAAITVLGLAGVLTVTACGSNPAPTQVAAAPVYQSQPASTPTTQTPAPTDPSSQQGPSPEHVAQDIADYLVSEPLEVDDGTTATYATCDPDTVSDPPDVSTPTTVSCDITYSDGSVWQQTVTITYDDQGDPDTISTNDGIELSSQ